MIKRFNGSIGLFDAGNVVNFSINLATVGARRAFLNVSIAKTDPPSINGVVNNGGLEWSKGLTSLSDFSMLAISSTSPSTSPPDFRGPTKIYFYV